MNFGEVLQTWGPVVVSAVFAGGIGGFLKVLFDRKLSKAQAQKTLVEGDVAESADQREWVKEAREDVRVAREAARAAQTDADSARQVAWRAQDVAAEARRDNADLRDRVQDLVDLVQSCGCTGCPIRPQLAAVVRSPLPDPPGGDSTDG